MGHESNRTLKKIDIQNGVFWISENIDTSLSDEDLEGDIAVCLLADLFGKSTSSVVRRIRRYENLSRKPT